ncbi:lysozyme inhibitor LprI family protein [Cognatilysobacter lacus]|uniref:DUF1311 domain-containing protein n=1 Tax=Cognatilysobacter lacus TaxID=1643323 RepID=A0A5D8YW95_9GAMM|nr:DUF1311 domain-containing protein [Lysobacter lacus]
MIKRILLLALAALLSTQAFANCRSTQNQIEMNECSAADLAQATREINRTYQQLLGELNPDRRARMRAVQLQWIKFKDLNCEFEASYMEGGSAEPMLRNSCLAEMTRSRNKDLKISLEQYRP